MGWVLSNFLTLTKAKQLFSSMKTKERGGQQQRPLVVDQSPHKIEEEDIGTVWGGLIFLSSAS